MWLYVKSERRGTGNNLHTYTPKMVNKNPWYLQFLQIDMVMLGCITNGTTSKMETVL